MQRQQCQHCHHSMKPGGNTNYEVLCHRYPKKKTKSVWDWCGEFKPKEQEGPETDLQKFERIATLLNPSFALYCVDEDKESDMVIMDEYYAWLARFRAHYDSKFIRWLSKQVIKD